MEPIESKAALLDCSTPVDSEGGGAPAPVETGAEEPEAEPVGQATVTVMVVPE